MGGLSEAASSVAPDVARLLAESERARADAESARAEADAARRAAESANRVKSEFLATMSHEFRTPLNAVLGYAQLLDMGVLGPATAAQHAHLDRLQSSARHLLRLVDDVLDVAKVEADRLDVRHEQLMTGAVVMAAVTLVQPQATAKGVRLIDLGAEGPGVPFVGDEHRVRQVLVNLLSNAVKFTPPAGEVMVICGAADEPDPGVRRPEGARDAPCGWAFVRVEDSGPGIPPALLDRLFEPFVQGDAALTRAQGGTGLGLAISRRLARLMGGDVAARNRPDGGAVFTLWLKGGEPAPQSAAAAAALLSSARHTPPLGSASIGDSADAPLDDAAYAVLHALGVRLATAAETIAEWYVRAIRAEPRFPGARELPAAQIRDHVTPFVGLLASQLMTIGETRGQASELLTDGGEIQRVMAELHGAQRHRLGWSEADIERETPLLLGEVQRAIRGALEPALADGPLAGAQDDNGATPDQATRAAARYAVDIARHIFEQSTYTALRSYRFTKAADSR